MKIIVCMKQVPAGTKVDIDLETGAMKRSSGDTRTNPYDLFALETALALREKVGGTVTILTMTISVRSLHPIVSGSVMTLPKSITVMKCRNTVFFRQNSTWR